MIRKTLLAAALLIPAAFAFAHPSAPDGSNAPKLTVEKLTEKIHVIQGAGGNIAVLSGDEGVLVVDDGVNSAAPEVLAAIRTISDKPIRFVINTHWHPDHAGSNTTVGANTTILAHDVTRARLKKGAGAASTAPVPPAALPNVTIKNETRLYLNGETIQIIPLPGGHTDGDVIVSFVDSNVVHLGDIFFAGRFPLIDTDGGGSLRQLESNLDFLIKELSPKARLIPGHGPVSDVEGLRQFMAMVHDTGVAVIRAKRRGESVETMQKNKILEPWSQWSWDFVPADRFIEILSKATPTVKPRVLMPKKGTTDTPAPPVPQN